MTARRYSYLGPVLQRHGLPLSDETLKALRDANESARICWSIIARRCGVGRSTMYRLVCGGNGHASTVKAIDGFAELWRRADDEFIASLCRRWGEKRRASQRKREAA